MKPKRQKHNYTSELELKSLLIRSKNKRLFKNTESSQKNTRINRQINRYIKTYTKLNNKKYEKFSEKLQKRKHLKTYMKNRIISLSESVFIDFDSNERFGNVILLMIKSILTKPNFSGYTYQTEFYSDAISKILKYLHNFDHTLISKITKTNVNSFAYISQIIHNSIIFVINKKKKEQNDINKQVSNEILSNNLSIMDHRKELNKSTIYDDNESLGFENDDKKIYKLSEVDDIVEKVEEIIKNRPENEHSIIYYPKYKNSNNELNIITMEQYNKLHPLLKSVDIIREIKKSENTNVEL